MKAAAAYSILLFFSWSHHNVGDIAITPGILRLLQQHVPEAEVTVVAWARPEETRRYLTKRFPDCKVIPSPFGAKQMPKEFRETFEKADLILYNSGTMLSYGRWERNWNRTIPRAIPLIMAHGAGKPYGIYCQSFERFAWPSNAMFVPLLSDASFVFCRDGDSLEYLKSLGVKPPRMEFGPDATFAFDLRDETGADKFMEKYNLQPRKFITLNVRTGAGKFIDKKREEAHAAKLRHLIGRWVNETGLDVVICQEVQYEIEPARRLIYNPLPAELKKHVRFKDDFWLPDEVFSVYSRARAIVSMQGHSVILGLAAGTPVIYARFLEDGRKGWMLRDLGVQEWLFDIDKEPADKITAVLLDIHNDYDGALGKVKSAMDIVHKRQAETMAAVKQTLEEAKKHSEHK